MYRQKEVQGTCNLMLYTRVPLKVWGVGGFQMFRAYEEGKDGEGREGEERRGRMKEQPQIYICHQNPIGLL